jgi:hypothetical protein
MNIVASTRFASRRRLALAAAALLASAAVTAADDFPTFKPGLWTFQRTLYLARMQSEPPTQSVRKCTSPTNDMKKKWEVLAAQSCTFSPITHSGNRYTYRSVCKRDDRQVPMASTITMENDSDYRVETQSVGESGLSREVVVAHRVGDCLQ